MSDTRCWIGWQQPGDDYRPLMVPPRETVVGYWCSGGSETHHSMCAVVNADSPEHARAIVEVYWPDAGRERFADMKPAAWTPGDRFPMATRGNAPESMTEKDFERLEEHRGESRDERLGGPQ